MGHGVDDRDGLVAGLADRALLFGTEGHHRRSPRLDDCTLGGGRPREKSAMYGTTLCEIARGKHASPYDPHPQASRTSLEPTGPDRRPPRRDIPTGWGTRRRTAEW